MILQCNICLIPQMAEGRHIWASTGIYLLVWQVDLICKLTGIPFKYSIVGSVPIGAGSMAESSSSSLATAAY